MIDTDPHYISPFEEQRLELEHLAAQDTIATAAETARDELATYIARYVPAGCTDNDLRLALMHLEAAHAALKTAGVA